VEKDGVIKSLTGKKLLGHMLEDKSFTGKEEDIELYGEELKLQEPTFAEQEQLAHTTDGNGNF